MTTILAAAGVAVAVLLAGNLPTSALGAWNLRAGTAMPWAIVPMALYLWAYWQFIDGNWGSSFPSQNRRVNLRANKLSPNLWRASLAAGALGFVALVALLALTARLVRLPSSPPLVTPPEM